MILYRTTFNIKLAVPCFKETEEKTNQRKVVLPARKLENTNSLGLRIVGAS